MKPQNLKLPYSRQHPATLLSDRILYIAPNWASEPESADKFQFPGWSDPALFGTQQPVCVEYCSGNGAWIAEKARLNPQLNWVAVEKKFERVKKIWSKLKNFNLTNLIVIYGEAFHATHTFFPDLSIEAAYINFPDPWPKNRHAKNRLICPQFLQQLHRVLQDSACLTFVTDDSAYSNWFLATMRSFERFESLVPDPYYATECPDYGTSYFEQLWRSKARAIRYHQFKKQGNA